MKRFVALSLLLAPLTGCSLWGTTPAIEEPEVIVTERPETKNVIYRGVLDVLGASIYMEGTHRLELEDGRFVLLESNGLVLDEYIGKNVEVFGSTRATIEGSAIIMRVERIADLVPPAASSEATIESSSSSAAAVASSVTMLPASSAQPIVASARPVVIASSLPPKPASSAAPIAAPASSVAAVSSESLVNVALEARVKTMSKANMAATNWTQQYCSPAHLSFCFPIHKNWYFNSFGATSKSAWHVELSSEELVALGDGPISVVLVQGAAPGPDGQVIVDGGTATGIRAWSSNRHFVISAPASLEAAVRYITQELKAAPIQATSSVQ